MKVLVTGVTSFVGYHLAAGFRSAGHDVTGALSSLAELTGIRGERIEKLRQHDIPFIALDMTDAAAVAQCVTELQPAVWLQHAGYTKAYASPDYDLRAGFALNVEPLGAIFSAMAGVQGSVILTGTVAEYADSDQPHVETETCAPAMPYGLSKLMETLYAEQLSLRHGVPARVARLFLPFGPLDAPEKLLATVITSLREGRPLELTTCLQRRDFLHVDNVVNLYLQLIPDLPRSPFEIYNVCSGESPTLREVILEFAAILGVDAARCEFGAIPLRPGEPAVIRGCNEKARQFLPWTPSPWRETVRRLLAGT